MTLCAGFNKVPVRNNHVLSQRLPLYLIIGSFRLRSTSLRGETNAVDRVREALIVWRSLSKGYQTCRKTEKQQINRVYLSVCLSPTHLSVYLSVDSSFIFLSHSLPQSIYRPVCPPIYQCNLSLSLSLYVFLSVCLSIRLSIPLCFYLSVCLTICCLYTYPYTHIPLSLCLFLLGT